LTYLGKDVLRNLTAYFNNLNYLWLLKKHQWKKWRDLEDIQFKKLKAIISYAYEYVPYYHQLFRSAGFKPIDLKDKNCIKKIPITTKMNLRRAYPSTIAKGLDPSRHLSNFTSGSTGIPLRVIKDIKTAVYHHAQDIYTLIECGVSFRDIFVYIRARESMKTPKPYSILPGNLRTYTIPVFQESEKILDILRQIKPNAIETYPSVLMDLSICDTSGINPEKIFAIGETLSQYCRDVVRRAFNVEINELYGSIEFENMSFECNEHAGLHIITDSVLLEFLDQNYENVSAGETGEIVVTDLLNHAMPFIRYKLGDFVVPSDERCSCGRGWPLIKKIEGRTNDYLVLPSGRKMSFYTLYMFINKDLEEQLFTILQWQIIQEKRNKLVLKVIKGKEFSRGAVERLRKKIETIFITIGEEVEVDIQVVDNIPRGKTGKRQAIVSFVR
jgi:phenylacetate-CoA ligase